MEKKCRAKDPSACRTHGSGHLQAIKDNAVASGDAGAYLTARTEMEKKSSPVLTAPEKPLVTQKAMEAAAKSRWAGNANSNWDSIPATWKAERTEAQRVALSVALANMPNGVITDEAVEKMAITYWNTSGRDDWSSLSLHSQELVRDGARRALEAAAPHMGIALDGKASIRNMFLQMEDKFFHAADRVTEIKDNIGETISEGVDRITDRHEKPIPAEVGGNTLAWSDLNPFKSPFKNGKLR